MICPRCNQPMSEHEWDIGDDDIPIVIDIRFYTCAACYIGCLDLDGSKFDYYLSDGETRENKAIFQARVDGGYYDE